MSLQHPDRRRHLPVRLCDLRPEVLYRAARQAADLETDPDKVDELLVAALRPSDRVFFVQADAAPLLQRIAA